MKKIVLCTGGYDPIHSGHIASFKESKCLGDYLIVGLNSDEWLARKKGKPFMPMHERMCIVNNLEMVDQTITFSDDDNTACDAIECCLAQYPDYEIIFANGGDRESTNIPEYIKYKDNSRVTFKFGVGGSTKKNSSSWILEEYKNPKVERPWGWYRVLNDKKIYKVKELVIQPHKQLSVQRHTNRAEHWYVLSGECVVYTEWMDLPYTTTLRANDTGYVIQPGVWHQGINQTDNPCYILEVQYGLECVEDDIERRD